MVYRTDWNKDKASACSAAEMAHIALNSEKLTSKQGAVGLVA